MILKKIALTVITFCTISFAGTSLSADIETPAYQLLIDRVDAAGGVSQAKKQAMNDGRKLAERCALCHGIDGNKSSSSVGLQVPNLAAQQPLYLLKQMKKFASRERLQPTMHRVSKELNDQQRVTLALYFSNIELERYTGSRPVADEEIGKDIFQRLCIYCHGEKATGQGAIPRLYGQNPNYIVKNLIRFRDKTPVRSHAGMSVIARGLKDDEIEALSAYLVAP